jgi:hypothetical protein
MKSLVIPLLAVAVFSCGPNRSLLMDTKFDAPLRQKLATLQETGQTEEFSIMGRCSTPIDGAMRQALVDAGGEVVTMTGDIFTARVSSDDVFAVAALEFVTQVQLSQMSSPHSR